jgi:hypothetical protein
MLVSRLAGWALGRAGGLLGARALPAQDPAEPVVQVDPSASGLPGAEFIQKLIDWAGMIALWGSLGAILAGAAVYGLSYAGVFGAKVGGVGKVLAVGGAVGAVLAGLAAAIVSGLYGAARG